VAMLLNLPYGGAWFELFMLILYEIWGSHGDIY
jgi:hypothetical protein